ncbi:hydrolase Nlp/P60 [Actinomadura sp. NBRC 104425]|uniref:C40 family peptidase n=1 Tax=Actinomadura sp. NBRC 104425 TaxID=3032204 RepID=UPI0024A16F78|nr:bifunctional lytic transglycosylase/C40 family peptidase [Actinomadura sp. NBRC 104425]GLZ15637.1 hydrolase Nlp/P60 [Actinomadura sp. NBRC 104425]
MKAATYAAACAAAVGLPLLFVLLVVPWAGRYPAAGAGAGVVGAPTDEAKADIPPAYLRWYLDAAQTCPGLPWSVLAAIGKTESDHGRSTALGVRSGENHAGAGGPMQFLAATWAAYGEDGDRDGRKDRYNPADAIYGAARLLCAHGAGKGGRHLSRAIWHYNHSDQYVRTVLARAARYATRTPALAGAGRGVLAVRAALRWLGTPYSWGGGGPSGPTYGIAHGRGIKGFDCSGLVQYAWAQAGVRLPRVAADQYRVGPHVPRSRLRPGDLVFFADNPVGPATIHHVGIYVGRGRMIHAPQTGDVVRISPFIGNPARERHYAGATRPTPHTPAT